MSIETEEICLFGSRIAEEMLKIGLKQKQFATRITVSDRTLRSWLSDTTAPNLRDLRMIEGAGCDAWYIYSGEKSPLAEDGQKEQPSPAERAGAYIASLQLSESDAELLRKIAKRMTTQPSP